MSDLAHLTQEQRLEILAAVADIDPTGLGEDEITAAATACIEPFNGENTRHLYLLRQLLRETLDLKWAQILRANGTTLINLAKDCLAALSGDGGGTEPPAKPAKTPVTKPAAKPTPAPPKNDDEGDEEEDDEDDDDDKEKDTAEKPPTAPETPPPPQPETEPAKTPKRSPRRRSKKTDETEQSGDDEPSSELPKKEPVKVVQKEGASLNPSFEMGPWDALLGRLEKVEEGQKKLLSRLDQLVDLMKESHNDLGQHVEQQAKQVVSRVDALYTQIIKLLDDEDYVPARSLDGK